MKLKYYLISILILTSGAIIGQSSLNEYQYVIVPNKYDFLNFNDQYQLNSLTKFLFDREGFETSFDTDVMSQNLMDNPCAVLKVRVKDNSNMFTTKLTIELLNCKNEIVHTSTEGKSKIKDFKKGFHEALRNSFKSITALNYSFKKEKESVVVEETKNENISLPEVVEEDLEINQANEVVKVVAVKEVKKAKELKEVKEMKNVMKVEEIQEVKAVSNLLYAQANSQGFQLVDSTPKVVYILLKSSKEGEYILKNKNGILYKKGENWIAEYYEGTKLVQKELQIKF